MSLIYETLSTLLQSLTHERRQAIVEATEALMKLDLEPQALDALITAIILEAAEAQYSEDGGATKRAVKDHVTIDALKSIYKNSPVEQEDKPTPPPKKSKKDFN